MTWSKTKPDYEDGDIFWAVPRNDPDNMDAYLYGEGVSSFGDHVDQSDKILWWGPVIQEPPHPKTITDLEREVIAAACEMVRTGSDDGRIEKAVEALQEATT